MPPTMHDLATHLAAMASPNGVGGITGSELLDFITSVMPTGRIGSLVVASADATDIERFNADYVCDGTADDVQIQAAIDAADGGEVRLTRGTFNLAAALTIPADNPVSLVGQGRDSTILVTQANVNGIELGDRTISGNSVIGVRFRNFWIHGPGGATTAIGIKVDGCEHILFENVLVEQMNIGIELADLDRSTFINVRSGEHRTVCWRMLQKGNDVGNGHNNWAGFTGINCEFVISDNSGIGVKWDSVGSTPNRFGRTQWLGGMHYANTGVTGSIGHQFNCGANVAFYNTIFENPLTHLDVNSESYITLISCEMLRSSGGNSTYGVDASAFCVVLFMNCNLQRMGTFLHATAGSPQFYMYGHSKNDGNITTLFDGSWGFKGGDDAAFIGGGVLAFGTNGNHIDYAFINRVVRNVHTATTSGSITLDPAYATHRITLNGNITAFAISGGEDGEIITVQFIQDGTGSRTLGGSATVKWAGGANPTLTTTANRRDIFQFQYDGSVWSEISRAMAVV